MRPVGPRPAGFAFGKAVGVAACTGRPTLGGLLVELLEDPPADTKRLGVLQRHGGGSK